MDWRPELQATVRWTDCALHCRQRLDGPPGGDEYRGSGPVARRARVSRVSAPAAIALKDHQISEQNLTDCIVAEYKQRVRNFNYQERQWTIQRDVWSIAAIHKLRKGRRSAQLGKARHVFVTANVGLALASRHFEEADGDFTARTIPACITDTLAATIAWIEAPDLGRRMSTRRVIAQALAAVQPSQAMLTKLYAELASRRDAGTIDPAEYRALVADPLAREMLAQTTRNDPTRYNAQTTQEIIDEYRGRYERQAAAALEAERLLHEGTQEQLSSYRSRNEAVARRIAVAVGAVVGLVGVAAVVFSAWKSQVAWTVVGVVLGILGGSVFSVSTRATGWVYATVLGVLTPSDSATEKRPSDCLDFRHKRARNGPPASNQASATTPGFFLIGSYEDCAGHGVVRKL